MIAQLRDEHAETIADTWKRDVEATDRQLRMGSRVATRNVKRILGADIEDGEQESCAQDGDVNMGGVKPVELSFELQKSLRYAERGVKRMVKGLPE